MDDDERTDTWRFGEKGPIVSNRYLRRLKGTAAVIRFEIRAYLLALIGLVRVKVFFDPNKINRLEIGAGPGKKKDFITLDLFRRADFPFDLRLGLPFPDGSLDMIYSEHVLEHFDYEDIVFLLKDFHRSLKTGGILSVVVPDAGIYLRAYSHPEDFSPQRYCLYTEYRLSYESKIDYVNYMFYMNGEHRYMFDREALLAVLRNVGFKNVRPRDFDPNLDQAARRHESIYAEGMK